MHRRLALLKLYGIGVVCSSIGYLSRMLSEEPSVPIAQPKQEIAIEWPEDSEPAQAGKALEELLQMGAQESVDAEELRQMRIRAAELLTRNDHLAQARKSIRNGKVPEFYASSYDHIFSIAGADGKCHTVKVYAHTPNAIERPHSSGHPHLALHIEYFEKDAKRHYMKIARIKDRNMKGHFTLDPIKGWSPTGDFIEIIAREGGTIRSFRAFGSSDSKGYFHMEDYVLTPRTDFVNVYTAERSAGFVSDQRADTVAVAYTKIDKPGIVKIFGQPFEGIGRSGVLRRVEDCMRDGKRITDYVYSKLIEEQRLFAKGNRMQR